MNRVVPVRDENGWLDRCEGFIEDLGRERSLEATLRAAQTHLQHILESVSSGVLVLTPGADGIAVALCNRRLADLLQIDEPPIPGTPLMQCAAALSGTGPIGSPSARRPTSSARAASRRCCGCETAACRG